MTRLLLVLTAAVAGMLAGMTIPLRPFIPPPKLLAPGISWWTCPHCGHREADEAGSFCHARECRAPHWDWLSAWAERM